MPRRRLLALTLGTLAALWVPPASAAETPARPRGKLLIANITTEIAGESVGVVRQGSGREVGRIDAAHPMLELPPGKYTLVFADYHVIPDVRDRKSVV